MALDLGKEIGPLPLGAWIAVVAGGLGIAWYTRQGGPGDPTAEEDVIDTSGVPGVGTGAVGGWVPTSPPDDDSVAPNTKPTTNEEWAQQAINGLIAMGYSPTLVDSAIRKYLAVEKLSTAEFTVIGLALARYGSPPVPLPPSSQEPPTNVPGPITPPVKPPVKPPVGKPGGYTTYTVRPGDDLFIIAARLYKNTLKWDIVYRANRKGVRRLDGSAGILASPHDVRNHVGKKLVIPKTTASVTL